MNTQAETTYFNENGVLVTDSHVHAQAKAYPLTGSATSKTHSTEHLEAHPEETSQRRRQLLKWGALAGLLLCSWAGLHYGEAVREYFYVTDERVIGERAAQGIAFALAAGIYGLALLGVVLCVQVNRTYRMHHVYLDPGTGGQKIASSRNEAWIATLASALDQAIARQSVAESVPSGQD
jgi:hypothetical protein